jgi:molecular chaperone GrpE
MSEDRTNEVRDADFSDLEQKAASAAQPEAVQAEPDATAKLQAEIAEYKDKYLRTLAELENVRKRATKERSELLRYQGESAFKDLLEVVDDLERALTAGGSAEVVVKGVEMIRSKFLSVLGKWEIRAVETKDKDFDPTFHEALSKVPTNDCKPGVVMQELRKGYMYRDRLLRPAQVIISAELPTT